MWLVLFGPGQVLSVQGGLHHMHAISVSVGGSAGMEADSAGFRSAETNNKHSNYSVLKLVGS